MNKQTSITKRGASPAGGASKARISAKTRKAIGYLVTRGCTQEEAAKLAGMNRSALNRALAKPHTQDALQAALTQHIQDIEQKKGLYKALAWERAHHIAQHSKDEKTSLKAVELLTGEGRQSASPVSVTINNGGGYEFRQPGQRVVEIEGTATDMPSGDHGADRPAIAGPSDDVGSSE